MRTFVPGIQQEFIIKLEKNSNLIFFIEISTIQEGFFSGRSFEGQERARKKVMIFLRNHENNEMYMEKSHYRI